MPQVTMKELLHAGVHFGHQTRRWNPKMRPFVYGARNGIYIIDLQKTATLTKDALKFLTKVASEGKNVLFVGTKKQARPMVEAEAKRADQYYVAHRWLGGMLTNYTTIRQSIDRLISYENILNNPEVASKFSKKELSIIAKKAKRLEDNLGGIRNMKKIPGALFVIDVMKEETAVKEARKLGIPVVAVVDTNCDPALADYVIPGNDDAIRSVSLFLQLAADACLEGMAQFKSRGSRDAGDDKVEVVSRFEGDIDLEGFEEDNSASIKAEAMADSGTSEKE